MNNYSKFGTFNVETGEVQDGCVDKSGQMQYRKQPWYKRIFQKRPEKTEYVGTTELYSQFIWSNSKNYFDVAVYRKFNPYTNETYSCYARCRNRTIYFDVNAFEKNEIVLK
jgi:hypothetical protein